MTGRGLLFLGLLVVAVVASWLLVAPGRGETDALLDLAQQAAAAGELSAAAKADDEEATVTASADDAAFPRREVFAEDDGRARVDAAEVLVLDALGIALPGAAVEAVADGAIDRRTTDATGKATVRLPPAATMSLRARAPGHLPTGRVEHPFGQAATIKLVRAARLLARVQNTAGEGLQGVRVGVRGRTRVEATTGADGSVLIDEIRPGTYDLALLAEGRSDVVRASLVAGLFLAPGDNEHAFALAPGATVAGVVVEETTRAPIAGADVRLHWTSRAGGVYGFDREQQASTDAQGRFAFTGVAPGHVRVRADTKEHAARAHDQELVLSSGEVQVELALARAALVRGRVLDADKNVVADAEVALVWGQDSLLRFGNTAMTDARGRFEMPDIAPRDGLILAASKAGRAPGGTVLGKVLPGEVREGVEIELTRGFTVRGRVRDAAGALLAGAEVRLVPKHGAERYTRTALAEGDGAFRFDEVAAFNYRVEARAPEHLPAGVDLAVKNDKAEHDAGELRLQRAFVLEGVVVVRGAEVGQGGARVMVRDAAGKGPGGGAMTDELGRFAIPDLVEGDYTVDVRGPDVVQQAALRVRVPRRGLLRVPVEAMIPAGTGIVELRVLDPRTREPIAGVQFAGVDVRRVAFADGAYSLRGIPAGRVELRLRARGFQPAVVGGVIVLSGHVRDLRDVFLQTAASLRVQVVDERGRAFKAGQVRVALVDSQGLTPAEALVPAEADPARGRWTWDGLALSRFELRVVGPNTHVPSAQPLDAFAPQLTELRVQLARKPKPKPKPKPKEAAKPKEASGGRGG